MSVNWASPSSRETRGSGYGLRRWVGDWWLVYAVVATMAAGYKMPTYLAGPGSTRDNVALLSALCNMGAALYEPLLLE